MRMKKLWIVISLLLILLAGLFFWKGGHHAIALSGLIEEWTDPDDADQAVSLRIQIPGGQINTENGRYGSHIQELTLTCDTFWTEYADRRLFGLTAEGISAYTDGKILYMDTGKAYALPDSKGLQDSVRKLAMGLLFHGRVTKNADTYQITMDTDALELEAEIKAEETLQEASIRAVLPDNTAFFISVTAKPASEHTIAKTILDAMVRANMEPPMSLTEPLEVLLPALEKLLPLEGDLTIGVESGILKLSERVILRMDAEKAELERRGVSAELSVDLSKLEPIPAALLLLRHGEFALDGSSAQITVTLPSDAAAELCTALIPQIDDLGMTFRESTAVLTVSGGALKHVTLTAGGTVPFLVTDIPLSFSAQLDIR